MIISVSNTSLSNRLAAVLATVAILMNLPLLISSVPDFSDPAFVANSVIWFAVPAIYLVSGVVAVVLSVVFNRRWIAAYGGFSVLIGFAYQLRVATTFNADINLDFFFFDCTGDLQIASLLVAIAAAYFGLRKLTSTDAAQSDAAQSGVTWPMIDRSPNALFTAMWLPPVGLFLSLMFLNQVKKGQSNPEQTDRLRGALIISASQLVLAALLIGAGVVFAFNNMQTLADLGVTF
jgi:hypothetical protein